MIGRLGFLEVSAAAVASLTSPGAGPALSVSLPPATGVTVGSTTDANATLVRDLFRDFSPDDIDAEIDLLFTGDINVTSTVPGGSLAGSVGVVWDLDERRADAHAPCRVPAEPPALRRGPVADPRRRRRERRDAIHVEHRRTHGDDRPRRIATRGPGN